MLTAREPLARKIDVPRRPGDRKPDGKPARSRPHERHHRDSKSNAQKPSIFAMYWIITSSAPPPMRMSRESTNARPATLSVM